MRRRQLPAALRQRVRKHERQKWAATRGVDEEASVRDLPVGLRRDIKRHLCLDLVRQVLNHHKLQFQHHLCLPWTVSISLALHLLYGHYLPGDLQ